MCHFQFQKVVIQVLLLVMNVFVLLIPNSSIQFWIEKVKYTLSRSYRGIPILDLIKLY